MKTSAMRFAFAAILSFLVVPNVQAQKLPTDDEVNGILKICSVGRVQEVTAEVRGKIQLWKQNANASGRVSVSDLGPLLDAIKADSEVYRLYIQCVKDSFSQFLEQALPIIDQIKTESKMTYQLSSRLEEGAQVYIDRDYIYAVVPPELRGSDYIRTANDDK